ncbi:tetratricopeptide repeat protein [Caballeronia sp. LZ050]|uniref:tetratricopeptide repeat protein n=1 Tax=Caballeronia sp. LZ050 TaxID=3038570 RepID=UPI002859FAC4|nr:tetratricopeptide repeat protein [Caballeronia sp. LZ050]MDR5856552.1 tetratricopeptide repeat protein [Caballeronia sp. LZ050]
MSMSSAQPERQRLFSPFVVAAFGLLVALMLVLAYPRERLEERLLEGSQVDTLTVAYLEAWLRIEPNNAEVLTELTQEYLKAQRIADAQKMLARLSVSPDPQAQLSALRTRIGLAEMQAYALKPGDPARAARLEELDALLADALDKPWDAAQLETFAAKARALNDSALAGRYYERLAQTEPAQASRWLGQAASLKLAAGDYAGAADAFFAAQTHAATRDDERRLFLSALQALQSGDRSADALAAADAHVGSLARDRETLRDLTRLALAAGRPDIADRYARRLLDMSSRERRDGAPRLAAWSRARDAVASGGVAAKAVEREDVGSGMSVASVITAANPTNIANVPGAAQALEAVSAVKVVGAVSPVPVTNVAKTASVANATKISNVPSVGNAVQPVSAVTLVGAVSPVAVTNVARRASVAKAENATNVASAAKINNVLGAAHAVKAVSAVKLVGAVSPILVTNLAKRASVANAANPTNPTKVANPAKAANVPGAANAAEAVSAVKVIGAISPVPVTNVAKRASVANATNATKISNVPGAGNAAEAVSAVKVVGAVSPVAVTNVAKTASLANAANVANMPIATKAVGAVRPVSVSNALNPRDAMHAVTSANAPSHSPLLCTRTCMTGTAHPMHAVFRARDGFAIRRIADQEPSAPIEASDYELGFKVFLANGDLARAQRVAQEAVTRDPSSTEWRERLAQVAEWNHAPDVALASYLALARTRNDERDWKQVERLAPALGDNDAMLAAAIHESDRAPGDMKQLDRVVSAYEAQADPDAALRFLQARANGADRAYRRPVLERYARLAERKGDDDLAIETYERLMREFGPDPAYALKLSLMYYTRTRFDRSLAVLDSAKSRAAASDADFWRFYAMLATVDQQESKARAGYGKLVQAGVATPDDLSAMVSLYDNQPLEAGRMAEFAYRKTGDERLLELAVYDYLRARATGRIRAMLASLDPASLAAAEQSPRFLLARAQHLRRAGDPDGALADTRAAAALSPGDDEARAALIWALNERGSNAELRAALARYSRDAEHDSTLWAPYAAAYLRLSDARGALHMMHKEATFRRDDPLWALGYADALELNGRIDEAWRVRNAVWRKQMTLRAAGALPSGLDDEQREDLRARMVGLTDQFAGGDASREVLIELLRADRSDDAGDEPVQPPFASTDEAIRNVAHREEKRQRVYSAVAREAALGWLQSHDAYDAESLWLLRQYIDSATRPVYAEVTIALAEHDRATLNRLLDTEADWIPRQNRLDAEAATGRFGEVQTHAYEQQFALPDDEIVNQILREQLLRNAQAIAPRFRVVDQGGLSYTEAGIGAGLRLSPTQSLMLDYAERNQHGSASLPNVPGHDRQLSIAWRHLGLDDTERVRVGRRNALDDFTTFRLDGTLFEQQSLSFNYALGFNQMATETSQLIVGGVKHLASVGVNYRPDTHVFVGGRVEYARFYGQDKSFLGTGTVADFNAGYKLRAEYPDYTVRAVFTHGQYSASGNPGGQLARLLPGGVPLTAQQFMPQTFTQEGLLFSFGDDLEEGYTRAWRPFFAAGPMHDSNAGWTAQVRVGLAGSVFGNDQATMYYEHAGVTSGRTQAFTEYGVRYRWLY